MQILRAGFPSGQCDEETVAIPAGMGTKVVCNPLEMGELQTFGPGAEVESSTIEEFSFHDPPLKQPMMAWGTG